MTYARIEDGSVVEYPVHEGEIRLRFPNTSFPVPFSPPAGYVAVAEVPPPAVDHTEELIEEEPQWVDGVLQCCWTVAAASADVIAQRDASRAAEVRAERTRRLAASDWTQLADAPVDPSAWAAYRQSLRDLTDQEGFPWEVEWPLLPS